MGTTVDILDENDDMIDLYHIDWLIKKFDHQFMRRYSEEVYTVCFINRGAERFPVTNLINYCDTHINKIKNELEKLDNYDSEDTIITKEKYIELNNKLLDTFNDFKNFLENYKTHNYRI